MTVITVPLMPAVGVTAIVGVTVIACWTCRPVSVSRSVSRYVPAKSPVGTINHVSFVNSLVMVVEPNWFAPPTVWTTPATTRFVALNVASVILLNPVTVMSTLLPDTADVGVVSVGTPSTWIGASAVSVAAPVILNV